MGRLKRQREKRAKALAQGKEERKLKKLEKDRHAWCPECSFQLFTAAGRKINFCARCGWTKD
jgi:ribosomal protein S27AE